LGKSPSIPLWKKGEALELPGLIEKLLVFNGRPEKWEYYEEANNMKIAISSTGKDMDSAVDPRFGRAPYLIIVDSTSGQIVDVIDNSAAQDAAHGAGINAASAVAESGAQVVLTGRVGPKAFAVLDAAGIKVVSDCSGSLRTVVGNYAEKGASPDKGPSSDAHQCLRSGPTQRTGGPGGRGLGRGGRRGGGGRGRFGS
jgi:predicted Fe-Mo cluster-binding NifX family protein